MEKSRTCTQKETVVLLFSCFLFCFTILVKGASAQTDCSVSLTSLQPCLPYMTTTNSSVPSSECCTPLGTVLKSSTQSLCICQIPAIAKNAGISVNETRALEIARSCNQTVPAGVTSCLQASTPSSAPSAPSSPSGGGGTVPKTPSSPNNSAGRQGSSPMRLLISGVVLASSVSLYIGLPI
ncbi:hypothetical protein KP509_14G098300 [Ceratopteris richardii]|uniref:Bifunctional inhibitor/plant lipid transfer protein/seed storage helical domain-containing protein n=1 Tax=Ceratopteris richardii TaxID=49495 RepID=A0A8T2TEK9_CERRI|nr:hypothetical protein KP509_14G098300 [Ceratopteris richardii]